MQARTPSSLPGDAQGWRRRVEQGGHWGGNRQVILNKGLYFKRLFEKTGQRAHMARANRPTKGNG